MRLYYEKVKPTEKDRKPFAKGLKYKSVGRIQEERKKYGTVMGGRFTKETDKLVYNFNASIGFDQKFFHQDVQEAKPM